MGPFTVGPAELHLKDKDVLFLKFFEKFPLEVTTSIRRLIPYVSLTFYKWSAVVFVCYTEGIFCSDLLKAKMNRMNHYSK